MANMSYCRFENTLSDLRDCDNNWNEELSNTEERAKKDMLQLINEMANQYSNE